jgi:hypothetical protein
LYFWLTSERSDLNDKQELQPNPFVYCEEFVVGDLLKAGLEVEGTQGNSIVIKSELQKG